ncbi:MAG: HDOD domain-containing protein [Syntrophobacteraceae bacterium]|nr:HDOD domain-containing protein [Syntrophobacteraceae bacterium]
MTVDPFDDEEIRCRLSKIKELPPLPTSLQRLMEIIHSEVDMPGELESIISYDPGLSAKVLAAANSSFYGYRKQVTTLAKAIAIIGTAKVSSICIYTLLLGLFSNGATISEAHREMLWKHSFASSRIVVAVNRIRSWMNPEEAVLLCLLHDIGWIAMAAYLSEQFTAVFEKAKRENIPPWFVEMRYGLDHGKLGGLLARRWALPEKFTAVMEFHHAPERNTGFETEVGMVHLIDVLSHSSEYPELVDEEPTLLQCRKLYISEEEWEGYQEVTAGIWPEVEQLWSLLGGGLQ